MFHYNDYKLTFLPQKGELLISYETEEDSKNIKIKNGTFPQDGDFYVKDGVLYISESDEKTPLNMVVKESKVTITFVDDSDSTGVSMSFDYDV